MIEIPYEPTTLLTLIYRCLKHSVDPESGGWGDDSADGITNSSSG